MSLLACLLLRANEVVSRDQLIDALWGEQPRKTARNALQVQVHALRRRLGPERIATEGPGYCLRVERNELDLERFERLVGQGRSLLASGAAEEAGSAFREALALWRGPAFADVAFEDFAQSDIARLEELRLVALEERVEADLALARHLELVPELEALVLDHPLRERMQGQLILALYRSGRQTDALAAFRRFRRKLDDELGLEPGRELQELQQAILRQDTALRVEPPEVRARRHLPAPQTPFIGRRQELEEIPTLLRSASARLVTLTGAGGTGKTRIALQVAHDLADAFADGVYFVDLAPLRDATLVPTTIAHALGVDERRSEPITTTLQNHLRTRRLLLLLDNFEAVDEAASSLSDLLGVAPELALLVTSRTPLRLSAEYEYRVRPLPIDEAVQLFTARARAVAPSFRRASEEADEVSEICRRVDCLPLAIELAAARSREYSLKEMLRLLPGALELAGEGARDLPDRQRTLRAAIDWSYELLAADARLLFARLAVFAGGCTALAAEAVCGAERSELASLVARSLLQERLGSDGQPRFSMLESIREYAGELLASTQMEALCRCHADYYLDIAETTTERLSAGADPTPLLNQLESEHDNLRAALSYLNQQAAAEQAVRLAASLVYFWRVRGYLGEGRRWLESALALEGDVPPGLRARGLSSAGRLATRQGDFLNAQKLHECALATARAAGDPAAVGQALSDLGGVCFAQGLHDRAEALYSESAETLRAAGHPVRLATVLANLARMHLRQGDVAGARTLADEAYALQQKTGDTEGLVYTWLALAQIACGENRLDAAAEALEQTRGLIDQLEYREARPGWLLVCAELAWKRHDLLEAARLVGEADLALENLGVSTLPADDRSLRASIIEAAIPAIGAERVESALTQARHVTDTRAPTVRQQFEALRD